jgi:hypothetical protein
MKPILKFFSLYVGLFLILGACETLELDLTDNPNALSPTQADATFFLNAIQVDFAYWVHYVGDRGGELTRINYLNGRTYRNVYDPDDWDHIWRTANRTIFEDIRLMNILADESGLTFHKGMGKVFQAYILLTLVDYFGDVPYSEALQGSEGNLNPIADSGASVYQAAIDLLNSAVSDFNANGPRPEDFYYNGHAGKWIKAANSIRKKALLNLGDYSGYNAISDYISEPEDDFQFKWGTSDATPDTRHPWYGGGRGNSSEYNAQNTNYSSTGGGEYMSNWLMFKMLNGYQTISDPRMAYYFYRQVSATPGFDSPANEEVLECGLPGYFVPLQLRGDDTPFCAPTNSVSVAASGYWGRDHGNDNGIPPDGFLRTLRGEYPAGGIYDNESFEGQVDGAGLKGEGITPIMLSSWMHFMNAEVEVNTGGDPKAETIKGLTHSIQKADDLGENELEETTISAYVDAFSTTWDATSTLGDKLDLWATQFFISLTGNGIDAYNSYRRNGYPRDLQPNIEPDPGSFPVSMFYPANYTSNNSNATQKSDLSERVFWNSGGATNLK